MTSKNYRKLYENKCAEYNGLKDRFEEAMNHAAILEVTLDTLAYNYKKAASAYKGFAKLASTFGKIVVILGLCIGLGLFITGCASSNLTKTDDGMYYCHSDGKYYSEITKDFCEVK